MEVKRMLVCVFFTCLIGSFFAISDTVSVPSEASGSIVYGDANCNGSVQMGDAVLITQSLSDTDKFGINGSYPTCLTEEGADRSDVADCENGLIAIDALTVQKYLMGIVTKLPASYSSGYVTTTTTSLETTKNSTTTELTVTLPKEEVDTKIRLNGTSISVEGKYAVVEDSKVTISHSGTYTIEGKLDDGQIYVDVPNEIFDPDTVNLVFNGVNITGRSAPAIFVKNAESTSITLADDTENFVSDSETAYPGDQLENALIEAKDDITFKGGEKGNGSLTVTANVQPAVSCNNDIKIIGGNIKINSINKNDGLCAVNGKTSVTVKDGKIDIVSEGDGLKSSKGNVNIEGGEIIVKSSKDAIQAETTLKISGGNVSAFGDRGLTSTGKIEILGGVIVATASDNQCENLSSVSQPTMMLDFTKEWSKNNPITVTNASNSVIFEKNPLRKYRYALVSTFDFSGSDYKIFAGGIKMKHSSGSSFKAGTPAVYKDVNNDMENPEELYASLFDQSIVHTIDIRMSDSKWKSFLSSAKTEEWSHCDLTIDGEKFENVGIRAKGNSSLLMVQNGKYSFRFKLDKYDKYTNYHGLTEFCVNNMYSDTSCLRDLLCYNAINAIDGVTPHCAYSDVFVNGSLYSFYIVVEQPDKTFAERYAIDDDSNLYKATERSEQGSTNLFVSDCYSTFTQKMPVSNLDLKFGNDEQLQHLEELKTAINIATTSNYRFLEDIMDVQSFLKAFAVNSVMCNYDSYNGSYAHNYYLMYTGGKHYFVGWDYNLCLGNFIDGASTVNSDVTTSLYKVTVDNRPFAKLLLIPEYYDMYISYINDIMKLCNDPERYVANYADMIRSHVQADPLAGFTVDQFNNAVSKSDEGLQIGSETGDDFVFEYSSGGGLFGGGNISVVDFLVKRFEIINSSVNFDFIGDIVDMGLGEHLYGHSITLDGGIGVNFYVELTDELLESKTAEMVFTVPNGTKTDTQTLLVKDVIANKSNSVVSGGRTYYKFKCSISAKDMASTITAQLVDGEKSGKKYTYSVKDYAEYILEHNEVEEYAKATPLVKAMLNYGAASQTYFGIEGTAANVGLDDADKALGNVTIPEKYKYNDANTTLPTGMTFEGATLSLKSETTLSLYFKGLPEDTEFTCNGKIVETAKNGKYVVARIRGIKANELENDFTVTFEDGSVKYSAMTYCYNVLNGGSDEDNLKNVCKALYLYAEEASKYLG
ncbi:MAG TPA: carbohydrate-binding domain-containing protein [Ruminococcus sp.]|nr:carbohydrate-binding domain-containing protein [Ruminococcus sp.]